MSNTCKTVNIRFKTYCRALFCPLAWLIILMLVKTVLINQMMTKAACVKLKAIVEKVQTRSQTHSTFPLIKYEDLRPAPVHSLCSCHRRPLQSPPAFAGPPCVHASLRDAWLCSLPVLHMKLIQRQLPLYIVYIALISIYLYFLLITLFNFAHCEAPYSLAMTKTTNFAIASPLIQLSVPSEGVKRTVLFTPLNTLEPHILPSASF